VRARSIPALGNLNDSVVKNKLHALLQMCFSLAVGVLLHFGLLAFFLFTTVRNSETDLVEANRFAWVLFWPDLLWNPIFRDERAETASLLTSILTFALMVYLLLQFLNRRSDRSAAVAQQIVGPERGWPLS
jgi:hypothetical protein